MVDGEAPEPEMTPEQRVDAGITDLRFGQAGLGSLGIGERMGTGGAAGGQFMFADLAELDSVLIQWKAERDRILNDTRVVKEAIALCNPPAKDVMSVYQAGALKRSLTAARDHHQAMLDYADAYVQKLEASKNAMADTEQENADRMRMNGED